MKRQILSLLLLSATCPQVFARSDGGAVAAGLVGGLAVGTMIGQAGSDRQSRRTDRAEQEAIRAREEAEYSRQEAIRAQDKAEHLRIEQERQRINTLEKELERREIAHKLAESGGAQNNMNMILMVFVIILLFAVIGLSIVIFRRKP